MHDTAITDAHGNPLAVYHFTPEMDFETFEKGDIGFHFGTREQADQRSKDLKAETGRMFRAYLNIQNPVHVNADIMGWSSNGTALKLWSMGVLTDAELKQVDDLWEMGDKYNSKSAQKLREILRSKGYDGITYPNGFEGQGDSYIAFEDAQIVRTDILIMKDMQQSERRSSVSRTDEDKSAVIDQLRNYLDGKISRDELNSSIDAIDNRRRGASNNTSAKFSEAQQLVRDAHAQQMSVEEYLEENAELYDNDGRWNKTAREALRLEETGYDGKMYSVSDVEEYKKPITAEDVMALREIGGKSINDFTSEDIKKAGKWAYKFYQELGTKSPFFRAWFGDWRAYDQSRVDVISQEISERGIEKNKDTNWDIMVSRHIFKETNHQSSASVKNAVKYLPYINDITKNFVLISSETSEKENNLSIFFHSLYGYTEAMGYPALLKLTIEELADEKSGESIRRDYILQSIEEEPVSESQRLSKAHQSKTGSSSISISDLFSLVKKYDKEFHPKPVNPILLNKDGTPKVFYHGTDKDFTAFSADEMAAREGSFFFAENREDAGGYGNKVMEVYLTGENFADYDNQPSEFYRLKNKREQVAYLKERGYDGWYADMDSDGWGEVSVFSPAQIKSATDNLGTFDRGNDDINWSISRVADSQKSPYSLPEDLERAYGKDNLVYDILDANRGHTLLFYDKRSRNSKGYGFRFGIDPTCCNFF